MLALRRVSKLLRELCCNSPLACPHLQGKHDWDTRLFLRCVLDKWQEEWMALDPPPTPESVAEMSETFVILYTEELQTNPVLHEPLARQQVKQLLFNTVVTAMKNHNKKNAGKYGGKGWDHRQEATLRLSERRKLVLTCTRRETWMGLSDIPQNSVGAKLLVGDQVAADCPAASVWFTCRGVPTQVAQACAPTLGLSPEVCGLCLTLATSPLSSFSSCRDS
eukprot:TRINITY_DN2334_c0_g1_i2.p1 TRINITY_DN2334_c0_g1~~TRINITY_DN2334_c0_g1_i2.p1  ORF type:complete len:221 (-),score=51.77 TRINITY_DN2334_c0_g1_i2:78-740(-)